MTNDNSLECRESPFRALHPHNCIHDLYERNHSRHGFDPLPFRYEAMAASADGDVRKTGYTTYTIDLFSYVHNRTGTYDDSYRVDSRDILLIHAPDNITTRQDIYESSLVISVEDKAFLERMGQLIWKAVSAYTHLNGAFAMHAFDVLASYMRLLTDIDEQIALKLFKYPPFTWPQNRDAKNELKAFLRRPPSYDVKRVIMKRPDGSTREYDPSIILQSFSYSGILHFEPKNQDDENHHKFTPQLGRMVGAGFKEYEVNDILRWVWAEQIHCLLNVLHVIQRTHPAERWDHDMMYLKFAHTSYTGRLDPIYFDHVPGRITK